MLDVDRTLLLEATLDALALGIIVVRSDATIVFMNETADSFMSEKGPLRLLNGRLSATNKRMAAELLAALGQCMARHSASSAPRPTTLAFPRATGTGVIATLFCQKGRSNSCSKSASNPTATIILQDPDLIPLLPADAFAQLYSLTQAELRVAMALIPGSTAQSAAEHLGISCNTVKTHLQRIFEKTSTSRQADLVALMLRTTPPLLAQA